LPACNMQHIWHRMKWGFCSNWFMSIKLLLDENVPPRVALELGRSTRRSLTG